MILYRVARYGNEDEGADGKDTNFLVHAPSFTEAAKIVDDYLRLIPHGDNVEAFCNVIVEMSDIENGDDETRIIMGPSYEPCIQYLRKKSWYRSCGDDEWEEEIL